MDFISNKKPQVDEMLEIIGVDTVEELFRDVPKELLLSPPKYDDGLSEYEGIVRMEALAAKNRMLGVDSYLGAGSYEHHLPAFAQAICQKSELLTAYTPYQAEASQGMLQIIFEFQSTITALTGLDVANASLYDGASAIAEALLMALRHQKGRKKLLLGASINPRYRAVVDQYLSHQEVEVVEIPFDKEGLVDRDAFERLLDDNVAAVALQYPNFFGSIDDIEPLFEKSRSVGALNIVSANPIVYGLYKSARELGADIAVGECQPLGIAMQYGGPYAGYISCKEPYVRQMPGRIVGETVDTEGRPGFVLTLQAREQHIRREKATSNICTNQSLCALASLLATLWYGPEGLKELATTNFQRSSYLMSLLEKLPGVTLLTKAPHLNEFVATFDKPVEDILEQLSQRGILAGYPLERDYPAMKNSLLIAVTETKGAEQLERYASALEEALSEEPIATSY